MKTKMFFGNQYVGSFKCDGRRFTTWQKIKMFARNVTIGVIAVMFMYTLGYSFFLAGAVMSPIVVRAEKLTINDQSLELYAGRIDELKYKIVDEVKQCESQGKNISVTYDPAKNETRDTHIPSFGSMQFKIPTVIYYEKLLNKKTITEKEAIILALDDVRARDLAKQIMFGTQKKAGDWLNCSTKLGTNQKIDIIKSLEIK